MGQGILDRTALTRSTSCINFDETGDFHSEMLAIKVGLQLKETMRARARARGVSGWPRARARASNALASPNS